MHRIKWKKNKTSRNTLIFVVFVSFFSRTCRNVYCCVTRYSNHTISGNNKWGKYNNTRTRRGEMLEKESNKQNTYEWVTFCGGRSEDFIFIFFLEGYRAKMIIQCVENNHQPSKWICYFIIFERIQEFLNFIVAVMFRKRLISFFFFYLVVKSMGKRKSVLSVKRSKGKNFKNTECVLRERVCFYVSREMATVYASYFDSGQEFKRTQKIDFRFIRGERNKIK